MKIGIVVTDASQPANVAGGHCDVSYRSFELPDDVAEFVREVRKNTYATVYAVIEREDGRP